jgi:hypothetical protein
MERIRRQEERTAKNADRERRRRAMEKARGVGSRDGRPKLGRQSVVLLDRVKQLVGEGTK